MCPTPRACGLYDRSMDAAQDTDKHRLKLIRRIGKGAYGEVFKGTYDGQNVAIKVPDACTPSETNVDMMREEAAVLSKCRHRRIIGYKALCSLTPNKRAGRGQWALVLEYANGGSLLDKVAEQMISPVRSVYSTAQALGWALDLASALHHLHSRSPMILHRDVKLSNALLVQEGGGMVAKLADLGLHMVVDDSKHSLRRASSISIGSDTAATADAAVHMAATSAMPAAAALGVGQPNHQQQQQQQVCIADSELGDSMATDATWLTDTSHSAAAGSLTRACSGASSSRSVWDSSMESHGWASEFETVFHMTGQTGSCMTMAPEVFLGQPYNEKADVFSIGVVLYELTARCLLMFTELPRNSSDPSITEWYAAKVAKGYRPARPNRISLGVWQLIEACWHQEPCARPSMAKVVEVLQGLAADELASKSAGRRTARKPAAPVAVDAASADGNIKEAACGAAHPANSGSRPAEGTARQPGCCVIS